MLRDEQHEIRLAVFSGDIRPSQASTFAWQIQHDWMSREMPRQHFVSSKWRRKRLELMKIIGTNCWGYSSTSLYSHLSVSITISIRANTNVPRKTQNNKTKRAKRPKRNRQNQRNHRNVQREMRSPQNADSTDRAGLSTISFFR